MRRGGGGSGGSENFEKGWKPAMSSFIANAHNELNALSMEIDEMQTKLLRPIGGAASHRRSH